MELRPNSPVPGTVGLDLTIDLFLFMHMSYACTEKTSFMRENKIDFSKTSG